MTVSNPSMVHRVIDLQRLALWVFVGCVCSVGSISNGFASIVVSYDLTGAVGSQGATLGDAPAAGIVADDLTRGSALGVKKVQDTISATGWSTAEDAYFSFGFTIDAATSVNLDTIDIRTQSSDRGPGTLGLFYSTDGFVTSSVVGDNILVQSGTIPLDSSIDLSSIVPLQNLSNVTVDFRIRQIGTLAADGSKQTNPSGSFSISNVGGSSATPFTINGTISAVPEVTSPLVLMGVLVAASIFRRRR